MSNKNPYSQKELQNYYKYFCTHYLEFLEEASISQHYDYAADEARTIVAEMQSSLPSSVEELYEIGITVMINFMTSFLDTKQNIDQFLDEFIKWNRHKTWNAYSLKTATEIRSWFQTDEALKQYYVDESVIEDNEENL